MNKTTIIGKISSDIKTVQRGEYTVTNFDVAVNNRKKETTYIRATAWGKLGETIAKFFSKGSRIFLSGESSVSAYIGNDGTAKAKMELTVNEFEFLASAGTQARAATALKAEYVDRYDDPTANKAFIDVTDEVDDVFPF